MKTVLVVDTNLEMRNLIKKELEETGLFSEITLTSNPIDISADVLIYDLSFGLEYIEKNASKYKHIIATTSNTLDEATINNLKNLNIPFCFEKPFNVASFANVISNMINYKNTFHLVKAPISKDMDSDEYIYLETTVDHLLKQIGFRCSLSSYKYISISIIEIYNNHSILNNLQEHLYSKLEAKYNLNHGNVERAIRHGVAKAFERGNAELIEEIFGYAISKDKGVPTNKEFFAAFVRYLHLKYKNEIISE